MARFTKKTLFSFMSFGMAASACLPVVACGPGGGGGYASNFGGSYSYSRPLYQTSAPVIRSMPAHTVLGQQSLQQHVVQQPAVQRQVIQQPALQQQNFDPSTQQPFADHQLAQPQQFETQQVARQQIAPPPPQRIAQQQVQQQIVQQPVQQQIVQQPQQQLAVDPPAFNNTEMNALQMLSDFSGLDNTSAAVAPAPVLNHFGVYTAQLPNSSVVRLELNNNGTFNWIAVANGKRSSFDGNFRMENGALTLLRGNDNQQLSGSWSSADNNGFLFKLNGTNDGGLRFTRS